jgi:beta-mannosidase
LIDATGLPKAAYYFVKRAMQARALFMSDEGLNGLSLHTINDSESPLVAQLELQLIRNGSVRVATGTARLELEPRSALETNACGLFEHFIDLTHAYRFGPRQYDVALATLRDASDGSLLSQASYFPGGLSPERTEELGLEATLRAVSEQEWRLQVSCKRFAHAIAVDVPGFSPQDSYFDLPPGTPRELSLVAERPGATPRGFVQALNAQGPTRINVVKSAL